MSSQKEVICFFVLFLTVYFLESIGGFYMTSAVVSIEKQFQIPSRMSGLMVSAGDFGYIPSVIFVSYIGGKGNRARWIGGGCLLIAIANILISVSNFLFPVNTVQLNASIFDSNPISRLGINEVVQAFTKSTIENPQNALANEAIKNMNSSLKQMIDKKLQQCNTTVPDLICQNLEEFLSEDNSEVLQTSKLSTITNLPYAFCDIILNRLRTEMEIIHCSMGASNFGPFFMIFGGLLILGVGRTMPFSLGLPLIDDNVKRKNLPLYFAGMFFIRIFGPVLGFMIGSVTNNFYYSFIVPPGLSPRDPMWIGRWWAGFLGIGIVLFGPSLALYLYPACVKKSGSMARKLSSKSNEANGTSMTVARLSQQTEMEPLNKLKKGHKKQRSLALVDRHAFRDEHGNAVVPSTFSEKASDFLSTVRTILGQPVYVGALFGRVLDVLAFKGFFVFLPKYLEIQFGLPQHQINLYMGIGGVAGFAVGVIIGCVVMRKFNLQGRRAASWVALCSTVAALISFLNASVGCKSALSLLGDQMMVVQGDFNNTCNTPCNCDGMPLYPVCNPDGMAFYSPCHAGCPLDSIAELVSTNKVFTECLCSNSTEQRVSRDFCDQTVCESKFILYFVNLAISGIIGGMGVIPAVLIILRSVPPIDRSISLGFQGFLVSLLATLPSPVIWGWIVDKSCVLWNTVCDDVSRGACSLYNADKLRLNIHITYGIMRLVALLSDIWVVYFAKDLILTDEEPTSRKASNVSQMEIVQNFTENVIVDRDRKFSM